MRYCMNCKNVKIYDSIYEDEDLDIQCKKTDNVIIGSSNVLDEMDCEFFECDKE